MARVRRETAFLPRPTTWNHLEWIGRQTASTSPRPAIPATQELRSGATTAGLIAWNVGRPDGQALPLLKRMIVNLLAAPATAVRGCESKRRACDTVSPPHRRGPETPLICFGSRWPIPAAAEATFRHHNYHPLSDVMLDDRPLRTFGKLHSSPRRPATKRYCTNCRAGATDGTTILVRRIDIGQWALTPTG